MKNHTGSAAEPICLDDSPKEASDDTSRKRASVDFIAISEKRDEEGDSDCAKRPRTEGKTASVKATAQPHVPQVPIKLFATIQNEQFFNAVGDKTSPFRNCHATLREMLGVDDMRDHGAIKWIVGCNYLIDFDYLIETVPELLSCPRTVFFYGVAETSPETWRRACTEACGTSTTDFVQLVPSDPPGSRTNPLSCRVSVFHVLSQCFPCFETNFLSYF
jgi:hypothetical protein